MATSDMATGIGRPPLRWRTYVTVALLIVLFVPTFRQGDGVPLSSYPMYAAPRAATIEFIVPVGLDVAGQRVRLSTSQIAATSDPLVAESFLRSEVRAGRSPELCDFVAARVDRRMVARVEVRRELHRVIDRALGDASIEQHEVIASCEVSP